MRLADLVAGCHAGIDPDALLADVARVARHDRYQASAGIAAAAAEVAAAATAAGLAGVRVLTFPADGAVRWWTFQAPVAWTPVRARLAPVGAAALVRYPEQPYTLAAYSAAVPAGDPVPVRRWSAVDWSTVDKSTADRSTVDGGGTGLAGTVVVLDTGAPLPAVLARLAAAGARALVADPLAGRPGRGPEQVGRLELPAGAPLAGFSVTAAVLARLGALADGGGRVHVEVVLDPVAVDMPVATGVLPGTGPGADREIVLTAHLCHPRPSANDNASGVAALLAVARLLAGRPGAGGDRPAVRFLWGPEFTGTAAYLHELVRTGQAPVPDQVLNVDMAGQDPVRCGGPLVIERGPDDIGSVLPALAWRAAALLPPDSRSYSGAVPCQPWTYRTTPYAGGSDHALYADAPWRRPTVAFGHWPDRTNHSSADTLDMVHPGELRRTAAVVAAVVAALRGRADPGLAADMAQAVTGWAAGHLLGALPGHRPPAPPGTAAGTGPVLDPGAAAQAGRLLAHRATVAAGAAAALGTAGVPPDAVRAAVQWLRSVHAVLAERAGPVPPESPAGRDDPAVLDRAWAGPANLRALAEAAGPADRTWLAARLAQDRGGGYARALALLRALDGRRSRRAAAWWAALSSELPVPLDFADRFLDLAVRAGWARVTTVDAGMTTVDAGMATVDTGMATVDTGTATVEGGS